MKNLLRLTFVLWAFTGFAQNNCQKEEKPNIEVTGTAVKEIVPDEIYITIRLKEYNKRNNKDEIKKQEEKLFNALKELGIDVKKNLFLSDSYANYSKVSVFKIDVVTKNEYVLKVSNATQVLKVFKKLNELKAFRGRISKVSHSKLAQYEKEVEISAIKSAKEKADYLLNAIGEKTDRVLVIKELSRNTNQIGNQRELGNVQQVYFREGVKKNIIDFKKIVIKKTFFVKFSIMR